MDFATQAAINPCESLMAETLHNATINDDPTSNEDSLGSGFKVYSYMTSLGCCIGYVLASVDWTRITSRFTPKNSNVVDRSLFTSEQSAFILVSVLFSATSVITILSARERPYNPNPCLSNDLETPIDNPHTLAENTSYRNIRTKIRNLSFTSMIEKFLSQINCRKSVQINASPDLYNYIFHPICKGISSVSRYCALVSQYVICFVILVFVYISNQLASFITKVSKFDELSHN